MGIQCSGWVENIVGKEEIARYKLSVVDVLTHYQTTILDSSKLKEFADDKFRFDEKRQKVIQMGRKHCRKRRKCLLEAISPFSTVFSKGLFLRGVERCHCVEMG